MKSFLFENKSDKQTTMFQDENLKQKFLKKGFWMYLFTLLGAPLLYFIRVIVSNDLPVADVGIIYSIVSLISIIVVFNDLGLNATMSYYLPKHYINKECNKFKTLLFLSFIIKITTAIIIGLLAFVFLENIALNYLGSSESASVLKIFLMYFFVINIFQLLGGFFGSVQDVFVQHLSDFFRKFLIALGVLGVLFFDIGNMNTYSFAWLFGISGAFSISLSFFFKKYFQEVQKGTIEFRGDDIKKYIIFGIWATIGSNALVLLDQIDQQMVLMFLGAEMAGYYANFIILASLIYFFKTNIFILENQFRFTNLLYLLSIGFLYYGIILGVNYKELLNLKGEFGRIRK